MEPNKKVDQADDLFVRYSEEIDRAIERAGREALLMHKRVGNLVPVERDGKMVMLQPEEIDV